MSNPLYGSAAIVLLGGTVVLSEAKDLLSLREELMLHVLRSLRLAGLIALLLAPLSLSAQRVSSVPFPPVLLPGPVSSALASRLMVTPNGATANGWVDDVDDSPSLLPYVVCGALVGGMVTVWAIDRFAASCDGCQPYGYAPLVLGGAIIGGFLGVFVHDLRYPAAGVSSRDDTYVTRRMPDEP